MTRVLSLVLCIAFCLVGLSKAQDSTAPHQHANTVIDGAVHPELIPDSIAYRLYFYTLSTGPNATEQDRKVQLVHLSKVGLQGADLEILIEVLAEFRTKHDALASQYNQTAEAALARNEAPDITSFLAQVGSLVQSTRDTLKLRLTPQGMLQLDGIVQSEKRMMKVQEGK